MKQPIADIPVLLYANFFIENIIIAAIGMLIKKSVIVNVIIPSMLYFLVLLLAFSFS